MLVFCGKLWEFYIFFYDILLLFLIFFFLDKYMNDIEKLCIELLEMVYNVIYMFMYLNKEEKVNEYR